MSVAENLAFRMFDAGKDGKAAFWKDGKAIAKNAIDLIKTFNVKTTSPAAPIAALSGGGLLAGIAGAFGEERTAVDGRSKGHSRNEAGLQSPVRTVGCSAANAAVMLASVQQGQPVELPEQDTLANALAGGIGLQNRFSFDLVRDLVDDYPVVDEAAIADAMRYTVERLHLVVEGGGAVGLAAILRGAWLPPSDLGSGPIVIVLSGGNVATDTLLEILREGGRQDH